MRFYPAGIAWFGHCVVMIRLVASCSALVIHNPCLAFTAVWRATYEQRNDLFGGSHVAASESPFEAFDGPSTAKRFSGSFAKSTRCSSVIFCAPFCQASDNATTWSIWTLVLVPWPRTKSMCFPV